MEYQSGKHSKKKKNEEFKLNEIRLTIFNFLYEIVTVCTI